MSLIGRQVGQYQVVAELGRGQHSVVYKARQQSLERFVTLKVLQHFSDATRQKLQEEALLTANLIQHGAPNLREIYEVGRTSDGSLFVAMEYVDESLRTLLARAPEQRRQMNPTAAARLLLPVAQALDAIHRQGWVHLDVKPQNILLSGQGRTLLADLGIARQRGARTRACTPAYASPEQANGDRPVGPWSDVYSLGAVLYEMVTGRPLFRGDMEIVVLNKHLEEEPVPPRSLNRALTAGQERAILRALAKAPGDRPRSATELIQLVLGSGQLAAGARRLPGWLLVAVLGALLLAAVVALAWAFGPREPSRPPPSSPVATITTRPAATRTSRPVLVGSPSPTAVPTSTLAPTATRTPRPTATRTPPPTATSSP